MAASGRPKLTGGPTGLRSSAQLDRRDYEGWAQRACLKGEGFSEDSFRGRPIIGICNTWSEWVHCNAHLRDLAADVKRGVLQAGGFPLEFPVMSLGEPFMKPTTMLYRNLMAMDIEESIRGYPMDGVVLLVGCDKTIASGLLGAASANLPTIVLTGGPQLNARWQGRQVGTCTDCWAFSEQHRSGQIDDSEWRELEEVLIRSPGHCSTMGTASTLACLTEALGLALPGSAAIPAVDSRRRRVAELSGRRIVDLVREGIRPSQILTNESFENAIRFLHALGGSTNAVIHLIALAGRVGLELPLSRFDQLGRDTPRLANIKPSGDFLMEDFYYAGGLEAIRAQLAELLHQNLLNVAGHGSSSVVANGRISNEEVIASRARPLGTDGAISVLYGNLCPEGAVLKHSAASPGLLHHEGPAVVFESLKELGERLNDPALGINSDSVMVLKNAGPVGAPGMPECGQLPIPDQLLREGVRDLVRISDARMSGTAYGTVVLHISPEAALGGPLALVRSGDIIRMDARARRLDVLVEDRELARRSSPPRHPSSSTERGYVRLYVEHVLQAHLGCDFDFLRAAPNR